MNTYRLCFPYRVMDYSNANNATLRVFRVASNLWTLDLFLMSADQYVHDKQRLKKLKLNDPVLHTQKIYEKANTF